MQARRALLPVFLLTLLVGCRGEEMLEALAEDSRARLESVPRDSRVLLSLHRPAGFQDTPFPGEEVRELGRTTTSILIDVPWATLETALPTTIDEAVVWGDAGAIRRLDPALRRTLLEHLSHNAPENTALPMTAVFEDGVDVASLLGGLGIPTRTVVGKLATLDATPEQVFALLALPGLKQLVQPRILDLKSGTAPRWTP